MPLYDGALFCLRREGLACETVCVCVCKVGRSQTVRYLLVITTTMPPTMHLFSCDSDTCMGVVPLPTPTVHLFSCDSDTYGRGTTAYICCSTWLCCLQSYLAFCRYSRVLYQIFSSSQSFSPPSLNCLVNSLAEQWIVWLQYLYAHVRHDSTNIN